MGTDWSTTADFVFDDQALWSSKIQSSTSRTDFKIASEAPEDIHLTFEELDIMPEEIEGSEFYAEWLSVWTPVSQSTIGGWTSVYSGGTSDT